MPLYPHAPLNQDDELALLDEDDSMDPEDEVHGMKIPDGYRLQVSKPAALDSSLLQRGVLVRLGMRWFGRAITRQSQERTRHMYDYLVHLEPDQSTRSMKLPFGKYTGEPDAVVGSWDLLVESTAEQMDGAAIEAVAATGVSRSGRVRMPNVTLVGREG